MKQTAYAVTPALIVSAFGARAVAQQYTNVPRVTTLANPVADLNEAGAFGRSLDSWKSRLVVGAAGERVDDVQLGAAYVYRRATDGSFIPDGRLAPPDGDPAALAPSSFALDVAIHGDWIVVGAPFADGAAPGSGAAFVYVRTAPGEWEFVQRLDAPGGESGDRFGAAVDVAMDVIVIGAAEAGGGDFRRGRAHVFERDAQGVWAHAEELIPSDANAAFEFGKSVATDGATVVVGDVRTTNSSAYVFRPDNETWIETARLSPNPTVSRSNVGSAVAVEGDLVVVGASNGRIDPTTRGGAFLYRLDSAGAATLEAAIGLTGSSVAGNGAYARLEGGAVCLGMRQDFNRGGPVTVWLPDQAGTWQRVSYLVPSDEDNFPQDLAFSPPLIFGSDTSFQGDRFVGVFDVGQFLGLPLPAPQTPDFNGDGEVNGADLGVLLGAWGLILR